MSLMADLNRDITIMTINIRGIKGTETKNRKMTRIIDLKNRFSPDFIMLQETYLDNEHIANRLTIDLQLSVGKHSLTTLDDKTGTTILVTSDRWRILGHTVDNDTGRIVTIDTTRNGKYYTLVNIYAPSGSDNHERRLFFNMLIDKLETAKYNIILVGDFNVTLHDSDRNETGIQHGNRNRNIGRAELQQIIDTHSLKDAYKTLFPGPDNTDMTHYNESTNRGARLDRIYVPQDDNITHCEHVHDTLTWNFTDHKAVVAKINSPPLNKRKSPHYKFNDTMLECEEYVHLVNFMIDRYLCPVPDHGLREIYGTFKEQVQRASIDLSKQKHKDRELRLQWVQNKIDEHHKLNVDETDEIRELKLELDTLLEHKYQGAAIRSRLKIVREETASQAFISIEKNVQKSRQIVALEDEQNNIHTDNDKILEILEKYYTKLFSKEDVDINMQNHFLQYATKLTDQQRDLLETPVTHAHIQEALQSMDTDSAPGPDGLTYKWYRQFWTKLSPFFLKMIDEMLDIEMLEDSQNLSYISLMLKDPDNPHLVKNYRPLALNNTDYKIITKTIAIKTSRIMNIVINPNQVSSVKGRKITHLNHTIRDIITYSEDKQTHTCILSIDQMKAFDRVDHSWIHRLLEHMNFGPYYKRWIRTIYAAPRACVLANGALSNVFGITRGVKQGDPLSSYLYTISLEPFLEKIRRDQEIIGITLPGGVEQKLVAFADDVNAFPGNYRSIEKIIKTSENFGLASGSKINKPKTKLLALGSFALRQNDGLNWVREIKMLGLVYRANKDNPGVKNQWEETSNKIKRLIGLLKYKKASIFGRATLANTLLTPKLNYLIQTLEMPQDIQNIIRNDIRKFIFHGTIITKINHNRLIQPTLRGGINLQDLESKIHTYRIQHLHDIINNAQGNYISRYYLALPLRLHIPWDNNMPHHDFTTPLPRYYKQLLHTYRQYAYAFQNHTNTKLTYRTLVEQKRQILGPNQIKHAERYTDIDFMEPFINLHQKFMTPHQKNITYRLLFSITPTSESERVKECPICDRHPETEKHLYYTCNNIQQARHLLTRSLISNTNNISAHYNENTKKAIFLNIVPTVGKQQRQRHLEILAAYRQVIWGVRLESKFRNKKFTQEAIYTKFKFWVDKIKEREDG